MKTLKPYSLKRGVMAALISQNPSILGMSSKEINTKYNELFNDGLSPENASLIVHKYKKLVVKKGYSINEFMLGKRNASLI